MIQNIKSILTMAGVVGFVVYLGQLEPQTDHQLQMGLPISSPRGNLQSDDQSRQSVSQVT